MVIDVEGGNLPGRSCNPGPDTGRYENIHVGIGPRDHAGELFTGDALLASWQFQVEAKRAADGSIDFRGPLVSGRRGGLSAHLRCCGYSSRAISLSTTTRFRRFVTSC